MLKYDFHRTRKGNMKMTEYLLKMKSIFEQLAIVGCLVFLPDLVIHVLAELDANYNSFVVNLVEKQEI